MKGHNKFKLWIYMLVFPYLVWDWGWKILKWFFNKSPVKKELSKAYTSGMSYIFYKNPDGYINKVDLKARWLKHKYLYINFK